MKARLAALTLAALSACGPLPQTEDDVCQTGIGIDDSWNDGRKRPMGWHVVAHPGTELVATQAAWVWFHATGGKVVWDLSYADSPHLEPGRLHVVSCAPDSPALREGGYWGVTRSDTNMITVAMSSELLQEGRDLQYGVRVMAHEYGHALGLDHTDEPDSLMYGLPNHRESPEPTAAEVATWRALVEATELPQ